MTANIFSSSKSRFFFSETTGNLSSHHHRLRHARARVHRQVFFSPFQSNREGVDSNSRKKHSFTALHQRRRRRRRRTFVLRLIFFNPIHITPRSERKNAPIYSKEFSLKDGGHIDTRTRTTTTTTTTDEPSRDFEEQSAAAKRNRYAFMREYLSSVCTFSFLLPENPIGRIV